MLNSISLPKLWQGNRGNGVVSCRCNSLPCRFQLKTTTTTTTGEAQVEASNTRKNMNPFRGKLWCGTDRLLNWSIFHEWDLPEITFPTWTSLVFYNGGFSKLVMMVGYFFSSFRSLVRNMWIRILAATKNTLVSLWLSIPLSKGLFQHGPYNPRSMTEP